MSVHCATRQVLKPILAIVGYSRAGNNEQRDTLDNGFPGSGFGWGLRSVCKCCAYWKGAGEEQADHGAQVGVVGMGGRALKTFFSPNLLWNQCYLWFGLGLLLLCMFDWHITMSSNLLWLSYWCLNLIKLQWGLQYRTSLVFEWSKVVKILNG